MDLRDELLRVEERFWTGSADFYERALTENSLLVFPKPVGVLTRDETVASLAGAPRWSDVSFEDLRVARLTDCVAILTYGVRARRGAEDPPYSALASSVYVRDVESDEGGTGWRLAFHQQTPSAAGR